MPSGPVSDVVQTLNGISNGVAVVAFLVAISSLLLRFRRSSGIERQQMKWFLFVASIAATFLGLSIVLVTGPISDAAYFEAIWALTQERLRALHGLRVVVLSDYMRRELVASGLDAGRVHGDGLPATCFTVTIKSAIISPPQFDRSR